MRKIWYPLALLVIIAVVAGCAGGTDNGPGHISDGKAADDEDTGNAPALGALESYIAAQSANDWDSLLRLTVATERESLRRFLDDAGSRERHQGLHNIKQARLVGSRVLSRGIAGQVTDLQRWTERFEQVQVVYVGIDYRVHHEDKYHFNGVNYRIAVLVVEEGHWRVAQFSTAPLEALAASEAAFDTAAEGIALLIERARGQGLVINARGEVLTTN